jgi:hypothetical protein
LIKNKGGCWGLINGNSLGEEVISEVLNIHLMKKRIRLEKGFNLLETNSL